MHSLLEEFGWRCEYIPPSLFEKISLFSETENMHVVFYITCILNNIMSFTNALFEISSHCLRRLIDVGCLRPPACSCFVDLLFKGRDFRPNSCWICNKEPPLIVCVASLFRFSYQDSCLPYIKYVTICEATSFPSSRFIMAPCLLNL